MVRKKALSYCAPSEPSTCGGKVPAASRQDPEDTFADRVRQVLVDQKAIVAAEEQDRFIEQLSRSGRLRKVAARVSSQIQSDDDIIHLIQDARDQGDLDEAVWRSFLAAHFGRASANDKGVQKRSASRLLYGFGPNPHWTWQRVMKNSTALRKWLNEHSSDLKSLAYGNHRKYESKQPAVIWEVIESFIALADEFGGPAASITADSSADTDQFDFLYHRLMPIRRFGRTGCFDFLVLLLDLGIIKAQPISSYLKGATGPRKGATKLWGKRPIAVMEELAQELAHRLGISPISVEDALCNWQK